MRDDPAFDLVTSSVKAGQLVTVAGAVHPFLYDFPALAAPVGVDSVPLDLEGERTPSFLKWNTPSAPEDRFAL